MGQTPRPEKKKKTTKKNVEETKEKKVVVKEEKITEDTKTTSETTTDAAELDEYTCYDDDAIMGKNAPSLASLDYVQGAATKYTEKPTVVLFWAKFLKWQVYPTMKACRRFIKRNRQCGRCCH